MRRYLSTVTLTLVLAVSVTAATSSKAETQLERGKYLATVIDCGGCHTTGSFIGKPDPAKYLAGSDQGWAIPTGVYWPANITPDKETGIGEWSKADIVKLLRTGVDPTGREVAPIMPWRSYRALTDDDMDALATFLQSIPAVSHKVPGPTAAQDVTDPVYTITTLPKP